MRKKPKTKVGWVFVVIFYNKTLKQRKQIQSKNASSVSPLLETQTNSLFRVETKDIEDARGLKNKHNSNNNNNSAGGAGQEFNTWDFNPPHLVARGQTKAATFEALRELQVFQLHKRCICIC